MESEDKCGLLAGALQKILSGGITLSSDVIHYIDSTFSNPCAAELQTILQDDSNCEKDSLMELIFFPDESMQLELEEMLENFQFGEQDADKVLDRICRESLQVNVGLPENRGSINLNVTEDVACRFISRLNISKHLNPDLLEALNRYDDENISKRIKVKIRNSRFSPTEEKIKFLCPEPVRSLCCVSEAGFPIAWLSMVEWRGKIE